jgi:dTDP-4-dehydrorhamnose reductase
MLKPLVVVTGKNGQLGWEFQQLQAAELDIVLVGKEELDLLNLPSVSAFFEKYKPAYFINCAAYTAVDKAETEQETARIINGEAVGLIAQECQKINCTLINISTDYVFDGNGTKPYQTNSSTDPVNYYGYTKRLGETLALENNEKTIIIRTSWLYSSHGSNFVKTMLRLMKERTELKVVSDQLGSPTYAADLANAILQVIRAIQQGNTHKGIYHYSNTGVVSWFGFAAAIRDISGLSCNVLPIPTTAYPTPAKRPAYSVMDTSDLVRDFNIDLKDWKISLQECLDKLL